MIVDTSALLHILFAEEGAERSLEFLARQPELLMASPALLEAEIVYGSKLGFESGDVRELIDRLGIFVVPFDIDHAREAKLAYARYGRGQGHAARLNFGDCITYALAKHEGGSVIFKGDDFSKTDLEQVQLPL